MRKAMRRSLSNSGPKSMISMPPGVFMRRLPQFSHLQSSPLFAQKAQAAQLLQRIAIEPPHVGCDDPRLRMTKSESTRSQEQQNCHSFAWGSPNSLSLSSVKGFSQLFYILMFRLYHLLIAPSCQEVTHKKNKSNDGNCIGIQEISGNQLAAKQMKEGKVREQLSILFLYVWPSLSGAFSSPCQTWSSKKWPAFAGSQR